MKHALAAGHGNAPDKRNLALYPFVDLLRRQLLRPGRAVMRTDMDAGIALDACRRVEANLPFLYGQRACRTLLRAETALSAHASCLRVVAVFAVYVAALEKNGRAVSGAVHAAEGDNPVDYCFHAVLSPLFFLSRLFKSIQFVLQQLPDHLVLLFGNADLPALSCNAAFFLQAL